MPHSKPHLPQKPCAVCGRPIAWRKKWSQCWQQVRYCSDRCRRRRGAAKSPRGPAG
ncbi:MAG: hypothetical protein CMJ58_24115 [Planctomycetaceae bacterium]|nr:hypothetical protein [Planctomycetaceae bacterium]